MHGCSCSLNVPATKWLSWPNCMVTAPGVESKEGHRHSLSQVSRKHNRITHKQKHKMGISQTIDASKLTPRMKLCCKSRDHKENNSRPCRLSRIRLVLSVPRKICLVASCHINRSVQHFFPQLSNNSLHCSIGRGERSECLSIHQTRFDLTYAKGPAKLNRTTRITLEMRKAMHQKAPRHATQNCKEAKSSSITNRSPIRLQQTLAQCTTHQTATSAHRVASANICLAGNEFRVHLDKVHGDQVACLVDALGNVVALAQRQTTTNGCAGGGGPHGVKSVDIKGQVDGRVVANVGKGHFHNAANSVAICPC